MPASFNTDVHNAALNVIAAANALHICSGNPTDRATVLSTSLATAALTAGDFTQGAASPNGRGVTVAAKSGVEVLNDGEPLHYCLVDATRLIAKTEVNTASPDLTDGSTTDIPAVTFSIADPTVV